ncbi:PREDICTED: uncharacterized protein LOC108771635, partial [Cyphomyrmex costatus]|uniref:uncharacterized protein LOC108771635 n=1 Tax=Cyphomyrmex costatus TaxID=456900 RepID=UPI000852324C
MDRVLHDWNTLEDERECEIIRYHVIIGMRYSIVFFGRIYILSLYLPSFLDFVHPLNESRSRKLPLLAEYCILDEQKYFYSILMHQSLSIALGLITVIVTSLLNLLYLQHACGLFEVIRNALDHKTTGYRIFDKNVILDQSRCPISNGIFGRAIIRSYRRYISRCLLIEAVLAMNDFEELLGSGSISGGLYAFLFFVHYFGQKLTDRSILMFDKVYDISWYTAPVHIQKLFIFILQRTVKGYVLNIGGVIMVSLESFASRKNSPQITFNIVNATKMKFCEEIYDRSSSHNDSRCIEENINNRELLFVTAPTLRRDGDVAASHYTAYLLEQLTEGGFRPRQKIGKQKNSSQSKLTLVVDDFNFLKMNFVGDGHYKLNRRLLLLVGLWPYENSVYKYCQMILCNILIIFMMFCQIRYLMYHVEEDWNMLKDKIELGIIERYTCIGSMCTLSLTILGFVATLSGFILSLTPSILDIVIPLNVSRPRQLPFPGEYFIDQQKFFYVILLQIYITTGLIVTTLIATETLYVTYIQHVCGMFQIASYRMDQAFNDKLLQGYTSEKQAIIICKRIIEAVHIHKRALKSLLQEIVFIKEVNEVLIVLFLIFGHIIYIFVGNYLGQILIDHSTD